MVYAKTTAKNGKVKNTPLSEMPLYCKCPQCGKEVKITAYEVQEFLETGTFDINDSSVYCEECQKKTNSLRLDITEALHHIPLNKLKEIYAKVEPYCIVDEDDNVSKKEMPTGCNQ